MEITPTGRINTPLHSIRISISYNEGQSSATIQQRKNSESWKWANEMRKKITFRKSKSGFGPEE